MKALSKQRRTQFRTLVKRIGDRVETTQFAAKIFGYKDFQCFTAENQDLRQLLIKLEQCGMIVWNPTANTVSVTHAADFAAANMRATESCERSRSSREVRSASRGLNRY